MNPWYGPFDCRPPDPYTTTDYAFGEFVVSLFNTNGSDHWGYAVKNGRGHRIDANRYSLNRFEKPIDAYEHARTWIDGYRAAAAAVTTK